MLSGINRTVDRLSDCEFQTFMMVQTHLVKVWHLVACVISCIQRGLRSHPVNSSGLCELRVDDVWILMPVVDADPHLNAC